MTGRRRSDTAKDAPAAVRSSRMRVNSEDVARAAGVSPSAVSRAFTPGASVAPEKRAKILEAARELGYRPNVMARAVATRRSNVVGLIMYSETNLHHPEVLLELSRSFSANGIRMMLFILEEDEEVAPIIDSVLSYQLDGVIAAASIPSRDLATLERAEVPVIFYNRPGTSRCASVSCDHAAAGREIAEHLLEQGHRSFALIYALDSYVGSERMRGVTEAIERAGGRVVASHDGAFGYDEGFSAVKQWIAADDDGFDAVIAANDLMAIGALDALTDAGRRLARDTAIAGFDGVDASRWQSHRIATIRQPIEQMAAATAEMMIKRIGDAEAMAEYRLFPGQLQAPRVQSTESAGGPRRRSQRQPRANTVDTTA